MSQPILIAIEGLDGCGKAEQSALTMKGLTMHGIKTKLLSFPNYDGPYGDTIRKIQNKELSMDLHSTVALYAMDRKYAFNTTDFTDTEIIICDRYVMSNLIHQGAKLPAEQWRRFMTDTLNLEFNYFGIPKPDIIIYLDMLPELAQKLMENRENPDKMDIDLEYQQNCRLAAMYAAANFKADIITCYKDNEILSATDINAKIMKVLNSRIEIK